MVYRVLFSKGLGCTISLTSFHTCLLTHKLLVIPPRYFSLSAFSSWKSSHKSSYDSLPYFIQASTQMSTQRNLLGWPPRGELPWSLNLKLLPLLHVLSPYLTFFLLQHLWRWFWNYTVYLCVHLWPATECKFQEAETLPSVSPGLE